MRPTTRCRAAAPPLHGLRLLPFGFNVMQPLPPRMPPDGKPKGPASYFPSIEKTYGQPIAHWLKLAQSRAGMKHMEIVNWLKTEHGLGHGHANAIVAYVLAAKS
jgi:hypothetical protein